MYDLLQVMQQDGYLSSGELIALRKTCKELGENPVRVLRSLNIASPEQIQDYLQRYFRVNALGDQAISMLDETYQSYIPIDLAIHYSCFGIGEEHSALYVAMEDPSDTGIIRQLRFFLNRRIIGVAATVFQLAEGLSKIYRVSIPNLRLTTVIEKSRGVIGGLRYEAPFESEAISIGDDFAGANLSDSDSEEVDSFVSSSPEGMPAGLKKANKGASEPSPEISVPELAAVADTNTPAVGFIDGSSGEVEQSMLSREDTPKEVATENSTDAQPEESGAGEDVPSDEVVGTKGASEEEITVEKEAKGGDIPDSEEGLLSDESNIAAEGISEEEVVAEGAPAEGISEEEVVAEGAPAEGISEEEVVAEGAPAEGISEEEVVAEGAPAEGISEEEGLLSEESGVEVSQSISAETKNLEANEVTKLSALTSAALLKVSLSQEKEQAIDYLNSLLTSFQASVSLTDDGKYHIKGDNYSFTGDASSQVDLEEYPVVFALDPVLKKILKMSNSA